MGDQSNNRDPIILSRVSSTLVICLNRPETKNALDFAMRAAFENAMMTAREDKDIRAVVITGNGEAFCVGSGEPSAGKSTAPAIFEQPESYEDSNGWFRELVNLEKPVIAAINGAAYGAGFNLALACDFLVGSMEAEFCALSARSGLVCDLGGYLLLPRIVGLLRAKEIVFSTRIVDAQEALQLGIIHSAHSKEQLFDQAVELAAKFHEASTDALGAAKTILNESFNMDQRTLAEMEAYAQAAAMDSKYHKEAAMRFLNKEEPLFSWEKKK
jgi:2-(1,2-epoxy-1,2-dihydrophenyl)acetyl-CoA isomerase